MLLLCTLSAVNWMTMFATVVVPSLSVVSTATVAIWTKIIDAKTKREDRQHAIDMKREDRQLRELVVLGGGDLVAFTKLPVRHPCQLGADTRGQTVKTQGR